MMKKSTVAGAVIVLIAIIGILGHNYFGLTDLPVAELHTKYDNDSHYVDVLGASVRIKESGSGKPLLLLHGFAASADTWDGWRQALSSHYRVIAVDLPPFGLTGPLPGRVMNTQELQNFMDALVAQLGLTQFYLAGNSLGGDVAWNYVLRHPGQVKKLILVDSAGYPSKAPLQIKLMSAPVLRNIAMHFSPRFIVAESVREVYGHPENVTEAQIQRYHDFMRREGSRPAVSDLARSLHFDATAVKQIAIPTLILWGGRDTWIPPDNARRFHHDIAGSQLIIYDELGHIPMEEDPARTAADVLSFLQAPVQAPPAQTPVPASK